MSDLLASALRATDGAQTRRATLVVHERVTDEELEAHDAWAISDSASKLRWLARNYRPTGAGSGDVVFERGCLDSVRGRVLRFRGRCEWFRKLLADVRFVQDLTGRARLEVVSDLWTRPVEAPLARLWATGVGLDVPSGLDRAADRVLAAWPIERVVVARNAIYRRYLLRYYLRSGAITREQFNVHRCKTTAEMDADPRLRSL